MLGHAVVWLVVWRAFVLTLTLNVFCAVEPKPTCKTSLVSALTRFDLVMTRFSLVSVGCYGRECYFALASGPGNISLYALV